MRKNILTLGIVFTSIFAIGQTQWTLESCINYALENNIQIKIQVLNTDINENQLKQSKFAIIPGLNAGANENITFGRSVDPYTNDFSTDNFSSTNLQLSSSVTLFSGLQQYNTIKKAEIDTKASYLLLEQTKNNIKLAIASAYLSILYAMDLLELAVQQKEITEQQLQRTTKLVNSGSLPEQNKYELEAQLANEELNIVSYENQLGLAKLNLVQFLELENPGGFEIIRPDIDNVDVESTMMSVDLLYFESVQQMPEIEYSELNYLSSEKSLEIAKGANYPRLTMSASYGTGYSSARKDIDQASIGGAYITGFATDDLGTIMDVYQYSYDYTYVNRPFNDQIKDNASTVIAFNLNIPIFNGLQTKTNVSNTKIYVEQSKLQVDQARKDLYKEIQQAHADALFALKQYVATEKTLEAMDLSFEYTQKRYDQGLLNTTDYNVAKNNLAKTQTDLLRTKYEYIFKIKILDFYRGITIRL